MCVPLITALVTPSLATASEGDLRFETSLESVVFLKNSDIPGQDNSSLSATFQPRYRKSWDFGKKVFDSHFFVRADADDGSRSHGDIRELSWTQVEGDFEYKLGISKDFWGVAESYNLIDVVNQRDYVEVLDYKARLGQPMAKVSWFTESGTFSGWVLPYFRERNFASPDSRAFSGAIKVDQDHAEYRSSRKERHMDFALRYDNHTGDLDYGVSYFQGTQRDPVLKYDYLSQSLIPYYDQVKQLSTDVQWTGDALLLKLEALHRKEATYGSSNAAVYGFEYTFFDIYNGHDLGAIAEHLYDSRGKSRTSFDNDLFVGLRYTFNDVEATEILVGSFIDLDDGSRNMRAKAERRFTDSFKGELILQTYNNIADNDLFFHQNRKDDFIRLNLRYYF